MPKDKRIEQAFHEVFTNEPSTVKRAKVSGKRKQKMKVAIALAKARKAGAKIPRADDGSSAAISRSNPARKFI